MCFLIPYIAFFFKFQLCLLSKKVGKISNVEHTFIYTAIWIAPYRRIARKAFAKYKNPLFNRELPWQINKESVHYANIMDIRFAKISKQSFNRFPHVTAAQISSYNWKYIMIISPFNQNSSSRYDLDKEFIKRLQDQAFNIVIPYTHSVDARCTSTGALITLILVNQFWHYIYGYQIHLSGTSKRLYVLLSVTISLYLCSVTTTSRQNVW